MKLQSINHTRLNHLNSNTENNSSQKKSNPSFGMGNPLVAFATFIENNGFMGEFLTIDTVGMMAPRTIQGYTRNQDELGHLNHKAGREELIRELLSGPAYFYVPLAVLTVAGLLRGKSAKVTHEVLGSFKSVMKNTQGGIKEAAVLKKNFIDAFKQDAFKGYTKGQDLIDNLTRLMDENLAHKLSFKDRVSNIFKKKADKKTTASMIRKEAESILIKLNKMNGKMIDNAGAVEVNGKQFGINGIFEDMSNYLHDFTQKASKTTHDKDTFIDKFHKNASRLRNITNVLAVSALSAFLMIIPKLYQTDKKFPGKDGLNTGAPEQEPAKEIKNENK